VVFYDSLTRIGPKIRQGGLGPYGSIEISPWVKPVDWEKHLKDGISVDFIYDPDMNSAYFARRNVQGHCDLANIVSSKNPYGGSIKLVNGKLRTNEASGHYGFKWCDAVRFDFIKTMALKCSQEHIHEPWVRDSVVLAVAPHIYLMKVMNCFGSYTVDTIAAALNDTSEEKIFAKADDAGLLLYQQNFIRKFGNSCLNPCRFVTIIATPFTISSEHYTENPPRSQMYYLKEQYRNKNELDFKFYCKQTEQFFEPDDVDDVLVANFKYNYEQHMKDSAQKTSGESK